MSTVRATTHPLLRIGKSSTLHNTRWLRHQKSITLLNQNRKNNSTATTREELTSRVIPTYQLSPSTSPLTAPFKPTATAPHAAPAARAAARFAVRGNAIVTGGAGDLGLAASRALLEHGAPGLMLFDLDRDALARRAAALAAEFPAARVTSARVDVTSAGDVRRGVAAAVRELGSADVLLALAGVASCAHAMGPAAAAAEEDGDAAAAAAEWRRVLDVNATGAFLCARAVARAQVEAGRPASLVLAASISAHRVNFPQPQAAYNASKAAVRHMASSLAAEWARYGIRVNTISPGYMDTILNEGDGLKVARDAWRDRNVMGRMGDPEELCGAVVLLASQAGSYITGTDLVVDGGQTLLM